VGKQISCEWLSCTRFSAGARYRGLKMGQQMRRVVLSGLAWLIASGSALGAPSLLDCIDPVGRQAIIATMNTDLEQVSRSYRIVQLREPQVDFRRSECRFTAAFSTGETRSLVLRIVVEEDGTVDYELELDVLLRAVV